MPGGDGVTEDDIRGRDGPAEGLRKLMVEDAAFRIDNDVQKGRTVIGGMAEVQIERFVDHRTIGAHRQPSGYVRQRDAVVTPACQSGPIVSLQ